jgi:flavin reductase (DIM6/NTAB) family NADH-FMN oxidoreductase RutF/rubredoxin
MKKWRCKVCGYIHEGETPPDVCPVCGVGPEEFEPYTEEVPPAAAPSVAKPKRWKCTVCDYIHEGDEPPDVCPVCGVGREFFVLLEDVIKQLTSESVLTSTEGTTRAALDKITYGLYVVTSVKDGKLNGQISNTVFQLTDPPLRIAVCLNRNNLTHEFISATGRFAVSVLGWDQSDMVRTFGYKSGRVADKFAGVSYVMGKNGCPILCNCMAYLEASVLPGKIMDVGTHDLFAAEVTSGMVVADRTALTYEFFRSKKRKG